MHLRIIILEDTPSEFMQTKHALEQYADLYITHSKLSGCKMKVP